MTLGVVVVNALAFGPRGPGLASRSCYYSNGLGQVVYSHYLPSLSQLQETEVQKGVFRLDRFDGLTD